jgi:hypothetical protein
MTEVDSSRREVFWTRSLKIRVLRRDDAVSDYREDWAVVSKQGRSLHILLGEDEQALQLSSEVIEAIYDMHQEIPR